MNKLMILAVLLAVISASVRGTSFFEECPSSGVSCSGSSSLYLYQVGVGSCEGAASSYCSAWATRNKCVSYVTETVDGVCRNVYVKKDAKCYTKAAAQAAADAYTAVTCDGKKAFGCATAEADGKAFACSFAASIIELSIALNGFTAECHAYLGVAVKAMAEAQADAVAASCAVGDGVVSYDYDYEFAEAVQEAVAKAWATCVVYCGSYGVFTTASGETFGKTFDRVTEEGGGEASVGDGH